MKIKTYKDLNVFKVSFDMANRIFEFSLNFPVEEKYSLTDQIRRSSRSICANIAEAYSARKYEKSFISKLIISQCEASETQVWLDFAFEYSYINKEDYSLLHKEYGHIVAMLINMINNSDKWVL
jgi:four helix bundle protein